MSELAMVISDAVEVAKYVLASVLAITLLFVIYALATNNPHAKRYWLGWFIGTVLSALGVFNLLNLPVYIIKYLFVVFLIAFGFAIYAFRKKMYVKYLIFSEFYILVLTIVLFIMT